MNFESSMDFGQDFPKSNTTQSAYSDISVTDAREYSAKLRKYRDPNLGRSMYEIAVTLGPFLAIWTFALWIMTYSYLAAFLSAFPLGLLIIRLFCLQHDAGHGSMFRTKRANDLLGKPLGMFTLTPYAMWRRMHISHHANLGNLDGREIGEVYTMTIAEYHAHPAWKRAAYRIYRNPFFLLVIGPFWLFVLQHRLPFGMWKDGWQVWASAMATNLGIFGALAGLYAYGGWAPILLIWLPSIQIGAMLGVWVFYVQHQFETAQLDRQGQWSHHQKALISSSHLDLPKWLHWVTGNMGIHHIHHINARVPFYRIPEVLAREPGMNDAYKMTLRQSLPCMWLQIWDEDARRLISFAEERVTAR